MPILLQKWFLFWKGTVTSFCKICILNYSEDFPLPKPQQHPMACSRIAVPSLSRGWMDVLNNTVFVTVWLGAFSKRFPYCAYGQPAPTISNVKMLSGEQLVELCSALSECSSWRGAGTSRRQMDLLWAFILEKDRKAVTCSPLLIKLAWGHSALPKWG